MRDVAVVGGGAERRRRSRRHPQRRPDRHGRRDRRRRQRQEGGRRPQGGWWAHLVVLGALLGGVALAACTTDGPEAAAVGWTAARLGSAPPGYELGDVAQHSSLGRRLGYRATDRGPHGDDGLQVQLVTSVPHPDWNVDRIRELSEEAERSGQLAEGADGVDVEAQVRGHEAVVLPATDDGRQYGWQVIWEQSPGVQVRLTDTRHDVDGRQTATPGSALDLAEATVGMDDAEWTSMLSSYEAADPYAGPPDPAVEQVVARGTLDGRPWELTVLVPTEEGALSAGCFRFTYAGDDTGPGCALQREVVGGKGWVIMGLGLGLGLLADAPELRPGSEDAFEPVTPTVHAYGPDGEAHVALAALPDGACWVEYTRSFSAAFETPSPLLLLPGDPGSVECATR